MANLYPAKTGPFAISDLWCDDDDDDQHVTWASDDSAILTAASADPVTVDETWTGVAFSATGAANLDIGSQMMSFASTIDFDDVTVTIGAGSIAGSAIGLGANGSITAIGDFSVAGPFTLDGGDIDTSGSTMTADDDVIATSGTLTEMLLRMTGVSADFRWTLGAGNRPDRLTVAAGAKVTRATSASNVLDLTVEATGELDGTQLLQLILPPGGGTSSCAGTISGTGAVQIVIPGSISNTGSFVGMESQLNVAGGTADRTLTQIGDIESTATTAMRIGALTNGFATTLLINGSFTVTGQIILGIGGVDRSGILDLTLLVGAATIGSIVTAHDANQKNGLVLADSSMLLNAAVNGNNQGTYPTTVTSVGANIVGSADTAEIKEVTSDAVIHCWGLIDGGDNNQYVAHESSLGAGVANVGTQMPMAA